MYVPMVVGDNQIETVAQRMPFSRLFAQECTIAELNAFPSVGSQNVIIVWCIHLSVSARGRGLLCYQFDDTGGGALGKIAIVQRRQAHDIIVCT
jgi:hypothetical protein